MGLEFREMACPLCLSTINQKIGTKDFYNIVQCKNCDLRFLDPFPTEQTLNEFYASEKNFKHYSNVAERKLKSGAKKIRKLKNYCEGSSFIDIGCGTGANVEAARRLGFRASGIDLCEDSIEFAKKNFPDNDFRLAKIQEVDKSYDLIFCTEVIEHVTDPHDFVESIRNIMSLGAVLYMTSPDAGHFRVPRDFARWKHVHAPDHILYFNQKAIKRLLEEHGIQVLKFAWTTKTTIQLIAKRLN